MSRPWKNLCIAALLWTATASATADESLDAAAAESVVLRALDVARDLESRRLMYSNDGAELRDCSGIFHRLLQEVRRSCGSLPGPQVETERSTRGVARWYADNGQLTLIHDAEAQDELIQPGTVMFYGERNVTYGRLSLEETLEKISHMGIVMSVSGGSGIEVHHYKLFHGRRSGIPAGETYHGRRPRNQAHPPLGCGSQQWIAAARLCEGEDCVCSSDESGPP